VRDTRKKISKDTLIAWISDGKTEKKSLDEKLKEVRSQANQKIREDDHIRSIGYGTKMDGSIQASARVETKKANHELETIFDEAEIESYLADKCGLSEKVFKNFKQFLLGGNGNLLRSDNMGYIGNHPQLQKLEKIEQEKLKLKKKEIAQRDKLIELEERRQKRTEEDKSKQENFAFMTELCDQITSRMLANTQVQPSKENRNKKKPKPIEILRENYERWAESNLEPETKKQYFKDNIRSDWEISDEYGNYLEDLEGYGLYEPAENQSIKV